MSDRERHVFDMRFRRAVNAYDRFAQSLRDVADCWLDDEYPDDWGVRVQQVMAHIRTAKMLLTRAMSDAEPIIRDTTVEQDELMELRESVAGLNNRLHHVDSAEAALMNSILRGDGDYVSMFIASQRVQQEMEEKIQQTVRGPVTEDATEDQPEEPEADSEAGGNQEVVDETSEDRSVKTSEDSEGIEQDESMDDTSENDDSIPPAEEQESSKVPYPPEADPFNFFERARLYGAEAIVNGTYDGHEGAVEDDGDDDPEAPMIIAVNDGSTPAEEQKPRELTTEEKIDLIRNDPELQRLIHDAARDIAISQVRDMIEDSKAATAEQQPQVVVDKPHPEPVYVTERGRDITPEELAVPSGKQPEADDPTGFVGRIRGKKPERTKDKPSKPAKTTRRIGRKETGGEQ